MKKLLLLFLMTLIAVRAHAQTLTPEFKCNQPLVDSLYASARRDMLSGNSLKALQQAQDAKQIAVKANDRLAVAKANSLFGWIFLSTNNLEAAESFALKALAGVNAEQQPEAVAVLQHQLGIIYDKKVQTRQALKRYLEAARYYRKTNNGPREVQVYVEISRLYLMTNDTASFNRYYTLSTQMLKAYPNPKLDISLANQKNMVLMNKHKFNEALQLNLETARLGLRHNFKADVSAAYYNAAGALASLNKPAEALAMVDKAIAYARANHLNYNAHLVGKAKILKSLGQANKAEAMFIEAANELHKGGDKYMEMKARKMLSDFYDETGQKQKAAVEFMTYKKLDDSISSIRQAVALKEVEYRYKDEEKEQLLESYRQQNKLKNYTLLLLALLGAVALYLVYYTRRSMHLRNRFFINKQKLLETEKDNAFKEQELARQREEQAILSQKLLLKEQQELQQQKEHTERELAALALYVSEKNNILEQVQQKLNAMAEHKSVSDLEELAHIARSVKQNLGFEKDWDKIKLHFEKVYPSFFSRLAELYPSLTQNELKHCAYIRLNMGNKETSNLLGVDVNAVKMSRYRIKKKIGLQPEQELTRFIQEI